MLDRAKLLRECEKIGDTLFLDRSIEHNAARVAWDKLIKDDNFIQKLVQYAPNCPWNIPSWAGQLDQTLFVNDPLPTYSISSVDGSQIYPDKHQGLPCFLINIGLVTLTYGGSSSVVFDSEPYVFSGIHSQGEEYSRIPIHDFINCRRQEFEFKKGIMHVQSVKNNLVDLPFALLFDGSLIFWHLDTKEPFLKDIFLPIYLTTLKEFELHNIAHAGYISLPKSRELVNVLRLFLCDFDISRKETYKQLDTIVDTTLASFFLTPGTRSTVFRNNSPITLYYPEALRPYFFYMHVGAEIARVEIPAWLANDYSLLNSVAAMILDQAIKGFGYPVALTEAHEQSVVKGPDRDFFYHLLTKMSIDQHHTHFSSQKIKKKLRIGI